MQQNTYEIEEQDLLDLIHWSRRYCDKRSTFAPSEFNRVYKRILEKYPGLVDVFDKTLKEGGRFFPYAQDGMHNEKTGEYDATR